MNNVFKASGLFFIGLSIMISSCKKEVEGCTDSSAMNYSSDATSNDGSCLYAFDVAQGLWYFTSECEGESSDVFQEYLPSSVNIEPGNSVNQGVPSSLSLLVLDTININATINNSTGQVTIPTQTLFSVDTAFFGVPISIPLEVSGTGFIESQDLGNLTLNYSLESFFDFTCDIDLFRAE